jgi:benzoate membrane transport protein
LLTFEKPEQHLPSARQFWRALDRHSVTNGLTAWLMATTGPFIVLLSVAVNGGMSPEEISSWVLGCYGFSGVLGTVLSLVYRMPLGMGWTIPGIVLLGGSLTHLPFQECIGAFYICAVIVTALGLSGWVQRVARYIPLSIVMAMVAGVFLPFVLKIISGFSGNWVIATTTVVIFIAASAIQPLARVAPPILFAIVGGGIVAVLSGDFLLREIPDVSVVTPVFYTPIFSWRATVELVLPLTITVVGIHNLQSFAICDANGYHPPRNTLTTICGLGSFAFALVGAVPTVGTGPANGILNASGEKERRYAGGVVLGLLMILFGVFAPLTTALALALPAAFIGLVGGLAMFDVLRAAFLSAFSGKLSVGAMTTFLVTVADQPIANIGAPFWAVVFGLAVSYLFEGTQTDLQSS